MKSAYISGPMTGYTDFNFPTFDAVRDALVAGGVKVFSPADHDRETVDRVWPGLRPEDFAGFAVGDVARYFDAITSGGEFTLDTMLAWDFTVIANDVDSVVMLPGWENSTGGKGERLVAEMTGKEVWLALWTDGGWVDEDGLLHDTPDYDDPNPTRLPTPAGWYFVLDPEKRMLVSVREA